jgi:hypothetical protein
MSGAGLGKVIEKDKKEDMAKKDERPTFHCVILER